MKRVLAFPVLLLAVVLLSGCGQKPSMENPATDSKGSEKPASSGIVTSIQEAMGLGQTMECTYTTKENGEAMTYKAYVDGKKYKSQFSLNGKNTISLFDGEDTMYNWTEGVGNGMKFQISCLKDLNQTNSTVAQSMEAKAGDEAFRDATAVSCQPADNIDFSVPTNITFQDQCATLKAMMKNLPKAPVAE